MAHNDTTATTTTDPWGRPIIDGEPRFGPLDGDQTRWPAAPMLVLSDEDVLECAAAFARAFSSEYFFTVWLIVLDEYGWSTHTVVELLDLPSRPPRDGILHVMHELAVELDELSPGSGVVVAIAAPDGGDRGTRERAWSRAVLDGAGACGLPVRGVVAVGAHRARLLHARPAKPG